eukprot:CAMPEP_0204208014 /NCGR_PEP_ID=MMETSP0361-20130328/72175_1 /ASSEMBLY_ACC=CAM_ASM_000343 /TAXON_ID=268821 /ORGANISM="Scrippsiella Hangoei, Strain SHTV-5" /LENGTH=57 /DNA_ID=CAMNT_0051171705 /DNA_START=70 /DNA_END=243 /DNA_ORIENTATION=+
MALQGSDTLAGVCMPQSGGAVARGGAYQRSVWREYSRVYNIFMTLQTSDANPASRVP